MSTTINEQIIIDTPEQLKIALYHHPDPTNFPGTSEMKPFRAQEFASSRAALWLAMGRALSELRDPPELVGYHQLKGAENLVISLAHTKGLGAAVVGCAKKFQSVGIDVEYADREMKKESCRFFINEEDDKSYSPLELWVIKEAAYKALTLSNNDQHTMKSIIIKKNSFTYNKQTDCFQMTTIDYRASKLFIAVASIALECHL